jgi:hypothetical protein
MLFKDNVQFDPHVTQEGGGSGLGLWSKSMIILSFLVLSLLVLCWLRFIVLCCVVLSCLFIILYNILLFFTSFEWHYQAPQRSCGRALQPSRPDRLNLHIGTPRVSKN